MVLSCWVAAAALLANMSAGAVDFAEEFTRKIQSARAIAPLGADLLGDSTDWYTGTTTFRVVDVDIPGNSALPVRIARVRSSAPPEGPTAPDFMGDWELELPYLSSVFPQNNAWRLPSTTQNRCSSGPVVPPNMFYTSGTFATEEYWRGYFVAIPGQGKTNMLWRNSAYTQQPADGNTYPWVTVGHTQLRCGILLANGTGEGFVAVTPDGTTYRFDWLVSRPFSIYTEKSGQFNYSLQRDEVRIYATRVEDRFGNYVNYTYSGTLLTRIESSDGRVITLAYNAANKVSSVTAEAAAPAQNRTWTYSYQSSNWLTGVTLPDGTSWSIATNPLSITYVSSSPPASPCNLPTTFASGASTWTFTHPSGASGQFTFTPTRHKRTQVTNPCRFIERMVEPGPSREFDTYALTAKQISGPGLGATNWGASYGTTVNDQKIVTLTNPDSTKLRFTFGTRFYQDEGKVLREEALTAAGAVLRSRQTTFAINPSGQAYAYRIGSTLRPLEDAFGSTIVTTSTNTTTTQDGATFARSTPLASFDGFARPLSVAKSSSLGFSKTDQIAYHDNLQKWVLGQVATVTDNSTGLVERQTDYHAASALPWREYAFGKLESTTTYNANGTPATIANGAGETTTLSNWKRGLPQLMQFPDSSAQSAVVDDLGWIRSVTDPRSNTTGYSYDVMGRITGITYPSGDTVAWLNPTISYQKLAASELGVPTGSWRREEVLGNFRERTYYDARLRPVLTEQMDTALAQAIYSRKAFDFENRETFTSYPSGASAASAGTSSTYDALGRLTRRQTTDATPIVIQQIAYLTGGQQQITDADSKVTTISFQAFDEPDYNKPTRIESHGQTSITDIARDAFGKITGVTQSGSYGGGTLSFTRSITFDTHQRPCRRMDPESGSAVWGYDNASRVAWEARGQSGSGCPSSAPVGAAIFQYDLRGRLIFLDHPGTADDVTRGYDPAGNLTSVVNLAATWSYGYNKRNLLEFEQAQVDGKTLLLDPAYNSMGQVASLTTPAQTISYTPDALGRQRQIGSYITGIQYHANNLPSAYSLGNGLTYTQALNNRLWPQVQETKLGAAILQRYVYSYSNTGNLTFLDDQGDGSDDTSLGYDNLHRLTSATGVWGSYGYSYDPLHNLRSRTGSSALAYSYDASNRLSGISGAQTRNYAYNLKGEITGDGIKGFTLNADGQITSITGTATYAYDGNGKRIKATVQGGMPEYALYSVGGDLLYSEKGAVQTDYVKLNGQTVVELRKSGGATTSVYLHPDYLGSPRKATNAAGAMLWQEHFDPYGAKLNGVAEKIGFTGHAQDSESGYVYMQARFYDPLVGRFLTTDPVNFKDENPFTFNRYAYGNNNPYKYVDPDGRVAWFIPVIFGITSLVASDAANGPGHGDTPEPQGGAASAGLGALVPLGWGSRLPQTVVMRETAETITQPGAARGASAGAAHVDDVMVRFAERGLMGSSKHGVKWSEGPARATQTGIPQGQFGSVADVNWVVHQSHRIAPGSSAMVPLPAGHASFVHLPGGGVAPASQVFIKVYPSGKVHAYPMQ